MADFIALCITYIACIIWTIYYAYQWRREANRPPDEPRTWDERRWR